MKQLFISLALTLAASTLAAAAEPSGPVFGAPTRVDNLAVYPITVAVQEDLGPVISLEEALAKKKAAVRERDQSGSVNTLVIQNKGDVAVFVLAGTVVKGGKQDRQIGQDFVVEPKKTVAVDAFCVEQGRWDGTRNGQRTSGKFEAASTLATSKVRAAGQHKKNQGEVWSEVSNANKANAKQASSDTLLATLDDKDVAARAEALAKKIEGALATGSSQVVGFAYAVDGKVRGARWFANHHLFVMYQGKLARTAAVDAITSEAEATRAKSPAYAGAWPEGKDVDRFVGEAEAAAVKETRDTEAGNTNEYKESPKAYRAKTSLKGKPDKALSYDFLAK